jgi:hypothetical protein
LSPETLSSLVKCCELFCNLAKTYLLGAPVWGRLLALPTANIWLGWFGLSGANTLAYYKNYDRKMFYSIGPRAQCYKTFWPMFSDLDNNLECLSKASLFSPFQCLLVRPTAYPRVDHLKVASLGKAPALPSNIRLGCEDLPDFLSLASLFSLV